MTSDEIPPRLVDALDALVEALEENIALVREMLRDAPRNGHDYESDRFRARRIRLEGEADE
jgi:hypothetical protein